MHDALAEKQRLTSCEHRTFLPREAPIDALGGDVEQITLRAGLDLAINWLNLI